MPDWCGCRGGVVPLVRRTRKASFDSASIANRDKYRIIHTLENSSTTCFSLYAFDGLVRRTLSQRRPCAVRSTSSRFAAGPSGAERSARSLRAAQYIYIFFEACFAKTVETPSPSSERSSFRKLLRTFATAPYMGRQCLKLLTVSSWTFRSMSAAQAGDRSFFLWWYCSFKLKLLLAMKSVFANSLLHDLLFLFCPVQERRKRAFCKQIQSIFYTWHPFWSQRWTKWKDSTFDESCATSSSV